jgi:ribonuclease P protein component
LRKHADYQRVYKTSRKKWAQQLAYFSVLRESGSVAALRSATSGTRVGLTVPKALGKAVDRNRIKRRLRELVRKQLPLTGGLPIDVVLHPKRSVLTANFAALEREVAQIFQAVGGKTSAGNAPRRANGGSPKAALEGGSSRKSLP